MIHNLKFSDLHRKEQPLVLLNVWDNESASILDQQNIDIIATSSYAIAKCIGREDGENLSFQQLLTIAKQMPGINLTLDIESGYASTISELQSNILSLLKANISGINIEDKFPNAHNLMNKGLFIERVKSIRSIDTSNQLFINARTDIFFYGNIEEKNQDNKLLDEAIALISEYQNAGVNGIFIPGLKNKKFIEAIAKEISIPVNIMLDIQQDNLEEFLNLGISRISYGPSIFLCWQNSGQSKELFLPQLIEVLKELQYKGKIRLTSKQGGFL